MSTQRSTTQQVRRFAMMVIAATAVATSGCAAKQQIVVRDDMAITKDVQERLSTDPVANKSKIAVETKAGVVYLSGAVATDSERSSAEKVARDTPGVRSVDNNVRFGAL